jgi:endo-beta-N-acetylglucosaminidase D
MTLESESIGLFDIGSSMKSFELDSIIYDNIYFDFLIYVVGPFDRSNQDFDNLYRGKNDFVFTANLKCFKRTKIILVLNEKNIKGKSNLDLNKESEKIFYSKMFEIRDYGGRVELVILDASDKGTYLDLWKNLYKFV